MSNIIIDLINESLSININQIKAVLSLFDGGATIPFIARYRKEMTGNLDEVQIAKIQSERKRYLDIESRKETILNTIRELDKLTPELEQRIVSCWHLQTLEDLYLPYRLKRRTKASIARENGLEPLAKILMAQHENDVANRSKSFIHDGCSDSEQVLSGARDIIAEWVNESEHARSAIRHLFETEAVLNAKLIAKKEALGQKYRDYFEFSERLKTCPSHRLLAIRRGESEKILRASIQIDTDKAIQRLERIFVRGTSESSQQVKMAIEDALKRLLHPSIETEFAHLSKEKADEEAIQIFSENLRQLLMAAPLGEKNIIAIDPGFRTGCKVVCLDAQSNVTINTTIYPHPPQNQIEKSSNTILALIKDYQIEAIAIGNGTAGRETERFMKSILGPDATIDIFMVNEAGASIYSASEVAREEFPNYDLTVRGAISIGRRLMDPLAELVKIDAQSIGVGQYQHDVNQEKLKSGLDNVVSWTVNKVGVNVNTASQQLLQYVSGLGPKVSKAVIEYREESGRFSSRQELLKIKGFGKKAFEQSAGFLRIPDAKHPLDSSAVHPESYYVVEKMAKDLKISVSDLMSDESKRKQIDMNRYIRPEIGLPTLQDIMTELEKPGLDPRGKAESFSFSESISSIKDIEVGMILNGVVTNLTKFGAFVDIGIKENGLIHISNMADKFIKDPTEVLHLNQKLKVKILDIDEIRKRIQLTLKFES
jgi:protein Tex